jgi:hypothetical protein
MDLKCKSNEIAIGFMWKMNIKSALLKKNLLINPNIRKNYNQIKQSGLIY